LYTNQFIQDIINDKNGKFFFDGDFVEGIKVWTRAPSAFFLEEYDHMRRIGVGTQTDNTCIKKFLKNFLNFIFLRKGMTIRKNIGRKNVWENKNGMIMNTTGRGKSLGNVNKILVFGYDRLKVKIHRGCLNFRMKWSWEIMFEWPSFRSFSI